MINLFRHAKECLLLLSVAVCVAGPSALAQPTEAQREAVKADCRNDYIAHCSSVPPGGEASLQCLAKNMSSLSSSCQAAVRAVQASAAPAPASTPPAAAGAKQPATNTKQPAQPAPKAAAAPPSKQPAAAAPAAGTATAAAGAPAAASAAPLVLRKMLPREELFVANSACRADIGTLCQGVAPGGGRIMQCLQVRSPSLSPACREVLTPFAVAQ